MKRTNRTRRRPSTVGVLCDSDTWQAHGRPDAGSNGAPTADHLKEKQHGDEDPRQGRGRTVQGL